MVGGKDRVEVDGLSCQQGEPLFFRKFWAFRRVGETASGSFEVEGIVLDESKSELQFGMKEGSTNLMNRLPWELGLVNPRPFCRPWSLVLIFSVVRFSSLLRPFLSSILIFFLMEICCSGSTWSSLSRFVLDSGSNLVFSFLMEDSLFVLVIVKHLDVDSEGVIEVVIMARSGIEELGEYTDDLGEDIRLQSVDACAVSLDNSVAPDHDLSLGSICGSRRSLRANGVVGVSGSGGLLSRASSGRRSVGWLSACIGIRGHSQTSSRLSL